MHVPRRIAAVAVLLAAAAGAGADDPPSADTVRTALRGQRVRDVAAMAPESAQPTVGPDGACCPRDGSPLAVVWLRADVEGPAWRHAALVCQNERLCWSVAWRTRDGAREVVVAGPFALAGGGGAAPVARDAVEQQLRRWIGRDGKAFGYFHGMFDPIAALGPAAIPHLIAIARESPAHWDLGSLAIDALGDCATAADVPAILPLLDDPAVEPRRDALVLALGRLGHRGPLERTLGEVERRIAAVREVDPHAGELIALYERLSDLSLRGGNPVKAIEACRELVVRDDPIHRPTHLYNLCCAHVHRGDLDAALDALEKSLNAGLRGARWLELDTDLQPLWPLPRFKEMLARATARDGR